MIEEDQPLDEFENGLILGTDDIDLSSGFIDRNFVYKIHINETAFVLEIENENSHQIIDLTGLKKIRTEIDYTKIEIIIGFNGGHNEIIIIDESAFYGIFNGITLSNSGDMRLLYERILFVNRMLLHYLYDNTNFYPYKVEDE